MQLPRRSQMKRELSDLGVVYGIVIATIVGIFVFQGPASQLVSPGADHHGTAERVYGSESMYRNVP